MATRDEPISAWYPDQASAGQAVHRLGSAGVPAEAIVVIGLRYRSDAAMAGRRNSYGSSRPGSAKGGWIGALCGLSIGLGLCFAPTLSTERVALLIVSVVLGSSLGSLISSVLSSRSAQQENARYVARLRAGEFLVSVHGSMSDREAARAILLPEGA